MAKLEQGILGPFSGKIGTVVGYFWRGIPVVRAYSRRINYPNTRRQQAERGWFVQMVRFASEARPALLLGLRQDAAREKMTEGNLFVKRNKSCFSLDGGVDYPRLLFSDGPLPPVRFGHYSLDPDNVLSVSFARAGGRASDKVYIYAYCPQRGKGILSAPVRRSDGRIAFILPDDWRAAPLAVYGFSVDSNGRASRSLFIHPAPSSSPEKEKGTQLVAASLGHALVSEDVTAGVARASSSSVQQSLPSQACGVSTSPFGCIPAARIP